MKNLFKKVFAGIFIAAFALTALPVVAFAADDPPPTRPELTEEKLEEIWARQLKIYERMGEMFDKADERIEKIQSMIDRASENGRDVSALQAALDAFEAAVINAKPIYNGMNGIVASHQGFDDDGKVTDFDKAKSTVAEMREKFKEINSVVNATFKALQEAIKAFREANKPEGGSEPGNLGH